LKSRLTKAAFFCENFISLHTVVDTMTEWRIGCSGFYYKEWKEIFYPVGLPQKSWFEFYCRHFNTIEINSSFYRQPSAKSFDTWYNTSPADFLFSIKAPRTITHYSKFNDVQYLMDDFYEVIKTKLKEKLGPVLFQLPPSFSYTAERLDLILQSLREGFHNVIEARHISWWNDHALDALKRHHISFSGLSYPSSLPEEAMLGTDPVYYRFHGKPVLYKSLYSKAQLDHFLAQITPEHKQVFVYFNNTWGESALINARQLQQLTAGNKN